MQLRDEKRAWEIRLRELEFEWCLKKALREDEVRSDPGLQNLVICVLASRFEIRGQRAKDLVERIRA